MYLYPVMTPNEVRDALVPIREELDSVLGKIYWQDGMAHVFAALHAAVENVKIARDYTHRA
jgi:hypothetical protein